MRFAPNSLVDERRPRRPRRATLAGVLLAAGLVCVEAAQPWSEAPLTSVLAPTSPTASSGHRRFSGGDSRTGTGGLEDAAESYVRLALALGRRAPREIDGYVGPARLAASRATTSFAEIERDARTLAASLGDSRSLQGLGERSTRRARLLAQVQALAAVAAAHARGGGWTSFDAEARDVYGLERMAPAGGAARTADDVRAARAELDRLVPGAGPLGDRLAAWRRRFVVPADRRRALFEAAVAACRARTQAHWPLPAGERVQVVWGPGGPWGAWHRYQGAFASTLEVSTASLELVDSAVDLACHEAYPGHHAQFVLLDQAASRAGSASSATPIELTVALLRSPLSLLREGAASYAVELAFPPAERLQFEREVLFPLAGLDPRSAADALRVRELMRRVEPAIGPIVREYRDGRLSREAAGRRLSKEALVAVPSPLLQFVDELGAYVVGYGFARDRVAAVVGARARTSGSDRWRALGELLVESNPAVLQ
jgi:hypothetical protein